MKKNARYLLFFIAIVGLFLVLIITNRNIPTAQGTAPQGYKASNPTTSQITIPANTALQVFATSTCISRIVSSAPTEMRFTLTDATSSSPGVPFRPSAGVGHLQSASTTVAYDSGTYGCDAWWFFNNSASTTIFTVTEFNGFK